MIHLKVKKLHPEAKLPVRATEGAACFDICATVADTETGSTSWHHRIEPGGKAIVRTCLAFEVPPGWVLKVYSRSGHGFKNGVRLVNGTGIIDADYRGELMVGLHNDSEEAFFVATGDRIAQAMLERVEPVQFVEVDELSDTARGAGGFGSTGA
jgi:dUTP pyrophosphatase